MTPRRRTLALSTSALLMVCTLSHAHASDLVFDTRQVTPLATSENQATLSTWQRLLARHATQTHWRFVLGGYLPAGCEDLGCPEASVLRRRAEQIMSQLSASAPSARLQWRGLPNLPTERIGLYLDSRQHAKRPGDCAGYLSLEDPALPAAWPERRPQAHSLRWRTTVPVSSGSRIRLHDVSPAHWQVTNKTGEILQTDSGVVVLRKTDLPARASWAEFEARRGLGDRLEPWTSQAASLSGEELCVVQFRQVEN